ncbi:hypothetical protein B0H14DRAFT_2570368 [Mycena olivaceomarginata]|nr:hypothetical protein B0H14DRAFT_2570368 [Mycena olivaceomarginata]
MIDKARNTVASHKLKVKHDEKQFASWSSQQKMFYHFSSPTLTGDYQTIIANIQSAVFALQWYMAEGKFPLDDPNVVFEFFERSGLEQEIKDNKAALKTRYTKTSLQGSIEAILLLTPLTVFSTVSLGRIKFNRLGLIQLHHHFGNVKPPGLVLMEESIKKELWCNARGNISPEIALDNILDTFAKARPDLDNDRTWFTYDYSPPLSTSSPLDTVNSVHTCPPTLTGQSLSSSPTASMGPTVHVQDEAIMDADHLSADSADPLVQLPWVPNPSEGGTMLQAEINFCLEDLDSASPLSPLSYSWNGSPDFGVIALPQYQKKSVSDENMIPRIGTTMRSPIPNTIDLHEIMNVEMLGTDEELAEDADVLMPMPSHGPVPSRHFSDIQLDPETELGFSAELRSMSTAEIFGFQPGSPSESADPVLPVESSQICEGAPLAVFRSASSPLPESADPGPPGEPSSQARQSTPLALRRGIRDSGYVYRDNLAGTAGPESRRKKRKRDNRHSALEHPESAVPDLTMIELIDLTGSDEIIRKEFKDLNAHEPSQITLRDSLGKLIWMIGADRNLGSMKLRSFQIGDTGEPKTMIYQLINSVYHSWLGADITDINTHLSTASLFPEYSTETSTFYVTTAAKWLSLPHQQQSVLGNKQLLIKGLAITQNLLKCDLESFEELGIAPDSILKTKDLSIFCAAKPKSCMRSTNATDLLAELGNPAGKVLVANLGSLDETGHIDPKGLENLDTGGKARMLTRGANGFPLAKFPLTRWAFASTKDATTPIEFNGSATVTIQDSGSQMYFVGANSSMDDISGLTSWHPFVLQPGTFKFEGILMEPGDVFCAAYLHMAIFGSTFVQDIDLDEGHSMKFQEFCNTSQHDACIAFIQIFTFWVKYLTTDVKATSTVAVHLPNVETAAGLLQILGVGTLILLMEPLQGQENPGEDHLLQIRLSMLRYAKANFYIFHGWFSTRYRVELMGKSVDVFSKFLLHLSTVATFYKRKTTGDSQVLQQKLSQVLQGFSDELQSEENLESLYFENIEEETPPTSRLKFAPWDTNSDLLITRLEKQKGPMIY